MRCLVLGAGRMGVRHAQGLLASSRLDSLEVSDVSSQALESSRAQLSKHSAFTKCTFRMSDDVFSSPNPVEVVVVSTTAGERLLTLQKVYHLEPKAVLVEKPLGQSLSEVLQVCSLVDRHSVPTFANLNMRLYDYFEALRHDFATLPQLIGPKTVTVNSGAVGIGANGIHLLDLLIYLFGASEVHIERCCVDERGIPSGRGSQFLDFGGYACLAFSSADRTYLGRAYLSLSSHSSVFGSWEIVGSNGRIRIDELAQTRGCHLRKPDSQLPAYRYGADYQPEEVQSIQIPELAHLTQKWFEALAEGREILPTIRESLLPHRIMFDWLAHSPTHQGTFPIT